MCKIPAKNFIRTVAANVDNPRLSDAEFREFIRNTLPVVEGTPDLDPPQPDSMEQMYSTR